MAPKTGHAGKLHGRLNPDNTTMSLDPSAMQNRLAAIPSVDSLLQSESGQQLMGEYGRPMVTVAIQNHLNALRKLMLEGDVDCLPPLDTLLSEVSANLANGRGVRLQTVINLTGTIIHTNLGRSLLSDSAIAALNQVAGTPTNLEYNLDNGERGERDQHVEALITQLTGAQAATLVNNNAAAVLIALNTLADGRDVLVSRGELVEIGGSFRIPDIMAKSGAQLVEVGTTNRTHLHDYENRLHTDTGALLKVHTSNYEIKGFTQTVSEMELVQMGQRHHVPVITDLGSGTLIDLSSFGLSHEPTVGQSVANGVDLVTFSGDKLLGGPQAGIIVGKKELIDRINSNPLKRALRVDKLTLAALAGTLKLYLNPEKLLVQLPFLRLLSRPPEKIKKLAQSLAQPLQAALGENFHVSVCEVDSQIGSGAYPNERLLGWGLAITVHGEHPQQALMNLNRRLHALPVPVIGRIKDGKLLLDLRTLEDRQLLLDQLAHLG